MYIDYIYYSTSFGGTLIPETSFTTFERRARVLLDYFTFNRLQVDATLITATVKDCLCEIIECNYNLEQEKINNDESNGKLKVSETIDKHSVTYAISDIEKNAVDRSQIDRVKYYNIAKLYLWDTGLLYRGI